MLSGRAQQMFGVGLCLARPTLGYTIVKLFTLGAIYIIKTHLFGEKLYCYEMTVKTGENSSPLHPWKYSIHCDFYIRLYSMYREMYQWSVPYNTIQNSGRRNFVGLIPETFWCTKL